MTNLTLNVRIISPKEDLFNGTALSVSSENSSGKFDILPQHANFITLIQNAPIVIKTGEGKDLNFNFPLAIVHTSENQVRIYTDLSITS
jgi:F0F1-type ATP synthase epsilon subunit